MSEHTWANVYQQRFVSTKPVKDALNEFLKNPIDEFVFYAKQEYLPPEKELKEDENAYIQRIAARITDIRNYSIRMGALGLQLAPPVDVDVHEKTAKHDKNIELDFSAFAPGAYWKIMQEFHRGEYPATPSTQTMRELANRSLAVYLPFIDLKPPEEFNAAANDLMQSLRDPTKNYKMQITKFRGVSDNQ
jgi:hypothetical protein